MPKLDFSFKPDVIEVDEWVAPKHDGPAILTMPNIPHPLHGMAPRTLLGEQNWDEMRRKCYQDANYICQASGLQCSGPPHAHELYSIDYKHQTMTFERAVCLTGELHTKFIHSGRAITMHAKGEWGHSTAQLLTVAKTGFQLIKEWNDTHPDEQLRVFYAFLAWMEVKDLRRWLQPMIEQYEIKFYKPSIATTSPKTWSNWKLIIDGVEYPTPYKSIEDWKKVYENE